MEDEDGPSMLEEYLDKLEDGDAADLLVLELYNKHFTTSRGLDNEIYNWDDEDVIDFLNEVQITVRAAMSL